MLWLSMLRSTVGREVVKQRVEVCLVVEGVNNVPLAVQGHADQDVELKLHKGTYIGLTRRILACLQPRTWLNDEVINVFMGLLQVCSFPHTFEVHKCEDGLLTGYAHLLCAFIGRRFCVAWAEPGALFTCAMGLQDLNGEHMVTPRRWFDIGSFGFGTGEGQGLAPAWQISQVPLLQHFLLQQDVLVRPHSHPCTRACAK